MKLQKLFASKYKNTIYYKWFVNLTDFVEKLGWKQGDEISGTIVDKKLILEKKR